MDDHVETLRRYNRWRRSQDCEEMQDPRVVGDAIDAACDKIDRLRAELAACREEASRYLKALYNIIDAWDGNDDSMGSDPAEIARAALSPARKGEGEGR